MDLRSFDPNDAESWARAEHVLWNIWTDLCFDDDGKKPNVPDDLYHGLLDVWQFCRAEAERIDPEASQRWREKQLQALINRMDAETN